MRNAHNKKATEVLCYVGAGNCIKKLRPAARKMNTLPVCADQSTRSISDHALKGWYPKGCWLNEFTQQVPIISYI